MNPTNKSLKTTNVIAYDKKVREVMKKAHDMLGDDLTTFYQQAYERGLELKNDALQTLKKFSNVTADLSIVLIEAKDSKKKLSKAEDELFNRGKALTKVLGSIQTKINFIIKQMNIINNSAERIANTSDRLVNMIMKAQDLSRGLRTDMNAYGAYSKSSDIARLFHTNQK
jgi:endonuclease III